MTHASFGFMHATAATLDVVRGKTTHRKNPGKRGKQGGSVTRGA
jgi:hypothetical protein